MDITRPPRPSPDDDASTDQVVRVRGLRKSYGDRVVVDDVDLDVHRGEVLGIIGTNGAGKTTTVEILQGLRRADAGEVRVLGLDPARDADRLRPLLGSQLQSSRLPDRMRVDEALHLFSGPRADGGETLLDRFGLAHRRGSAFGSMSGGEQQRLFLVLALLNRPRLVVLDELTQGLDPAARREVWAAVSRLRSDGTTVLLVTHELAEAEALCDRVVAMRDGRVLDAGTPAELVDRHAGRAEITFTLPAGRPAEQLAEVRALPGVQQVRRTGDRLAVEGERAAIAHVGRWLVGAGRVPADLRVVVPDLESALLGLLGGVERTAA
ncbi:ABC transporter ATP-binding protein [Nocardioides flavescens]|uniref:ATP-binding cassette domain-containing protein n=1 Tax=Nocardioides flavescens TaxID=2691959 RepID=A0A6L7ERX2_9ACTN|nr:ABC transporter ATP-binding protein [Nocardioides flavescens]MXG89430.1 ATP-binding cassette domain-containing protein [Nocardioides flavescens]